MNIAAEPLTNKALFPRYSLFKGIVKLGISSLLIYWLILQVGPEVILREVQSLSWRQWLPAFVLLHLAQIVSAFRMRCYLQEVATLTPLRTIWLYYLGMFYNLVLPGGIGGDGYKVYYVARHHEAKIRTSIRLLIAERANGLASLLFCGVLIAALLVFYYQLAPLWLVSTTTIIAILLLFGSYFYLSARILKDKPERMKSMFLYSLAVQILGLMAFAALLPEASETPLIASVLLCSVVGSVLGILPITLGGLGMREAVLYYAPFFFLPLGIAHLSAEQGVAVSLAMFILYAVVALTGWLGAALGLTMKKTAKPL
jgi:uncharacterized membrane protein YbhN (UPF0104 family)